jgi:hypothetical protein
MSRPRLPPPARASEIDVVELQRLWAETDTPTRLIADKFRTTLTTITGIIRRRRQIEGIARWPMREGVGIKNSRKPKKARPLKPGQSTLPPLGSAP